VRNLALYRKNDRRGIWTFSRCTLIWITSFPHNWSWSIRVRLEGVEQIFHKKLRTIRSVIPFLSISAPVYQSLPPIRSAGHFICTSLKIPFADSKQRKHWADWIWRSKERKDLSWLIGIFPLLWSHHFHKSLSLDSSIVTTSLGQYPSYIFKKEITPCCKPSSHLCMRIHPRHEMCMIHLSLTSVFVSPSISWLLMPRFCAMRWACRYRA